MTEDVLPIRYKAFLSYSHRDAKVAKWLHRALENYRVPKRLIGRVTSAGQITRKLGPIFRDREELPVAADLSGRINDALRAADFLVVLCSPAAAASRWVNQEVINFKRLKGADSIIAIITEGEPNASVIPGREDEECFVPALRFVVDASGEVTSIPAEPIAADLRPGKDGRRLARLKVLAGLLGIGLDELVRREQQRRQRLLLAVTAASLAGLAITVGLTVAAVIARNDAKIAQERAERQRGQAEGLVEFMLGDLRDKLQPVGRLDVLDAAGGRALEYFGSLRVDEIGPETLGRQARTLHLIGEIQARRGLMDKARAVFVQARENTASAYAASPQDPDRIFEHAQSLFWLGFIDWRTGKLPSAESAFVEYARLASTLVTRDPKNSKWLKEAGYASINLGVVRYERELHQTALQAFADADRRFAALAKQAPDDRDVSLNLAQAAAWSADAHRALGNFDAALKARDTERRLYTALLEKDPNFKTARQFLPVVELATARLMLDAGRLAAAISRFSQAADEAAELADSDPENANWRELEIRTGTELAEAQVLARNCRVAQAGIERVSRVLAQSLQRDAPYLALLGTRLLTARARCLTSSTDARAALVASSAALDTVIPVIENTGDLESLFVGAEAWLVKGDAHARAKELRLAEASWSRALELSGRVESSRPYYRLLRAEALERFGRDAEAQKIFDKLRSLNYRHPLMSEVSKS